jgi:hypothetical protein
MSTSIPPGEPLVPRWGMKRVMVTIVCATGRRCGTQRLGESSIVFAFALSLAQPAPAPVVERVDPTQL